MRAFLLLEDDGSVVAEGVEFYDGSRHLKWVDEDSALVHPAPVDESTFGGGWDFLWVTDVIAGPPEDHVPRQERI
jgi:hypothetical protein